MKSRDTRLRGASKILSAPNALRRRTEVTFTAMAGVLLCSATTAQPQATPDGAGASLEEVIVTARYRAESLQNTPIAITAVTADQLEVRDISNVDALGAIVPNTFIVPGAAAAGAAPTISMRGVFQLDFNFAFEPGVGIYIDDVYRPTLLGSALDLMDIERVEVLRGPQGTLFGKNSMGGAIRIYSKTPQGDDTGFIEATAGSSDRLDFRGSFDTALIPGKLFLRVSGAQKRIDGYVRTLDFACQMTQNGTPGLIPAGVSSNAFGSDGDCQTGTQGGEELKAGRAMLQYVATDKLEFGVSVDKTYDDKEVVPDVMIATVASQFLPPLLPSVQPWILPDGTRNPAAPAPVFDDRFLPPDRYSSYAYINSPNVASIHEWGLAGTVSYRFTDRLRTKLILAKREYDSWFSFNADASPYGFVENWNPFHHTQESAELQVSGESLGDRFEWTVGGFYFDGDTHMGGHIIYAGLDFDQNDRFADRNESAFVHGVYRLTDALNVTAGLRHSNNEKTFSFHHPGLGPPDPIARTFSDKRTDWSVGLDYRLTPDLLIYTTAATGYRPGGINPRPIIVPDQLVPFDGEELTSYEVGIKSTLLDGRLIANLAAFHSDYSSHLSQATLNQCLGAPGTPTPQVTCPANTIAVPWFAYFNDKATVRGLEAELTAEPLDGLLVNATAGWNDYESDVTDPTAPNYRHPQNLIQPEWNLSAGVQYGVAAFGGTLTPRLDWMYRSEMTYNPVLSLSFNPLLGLPPDRARDVTTTDSLSLFNARLGFASGDGKWEGALSVSNLFDKFYWVNKFALSGYTVSGQPSRPREWGVTVRRNF